MTSIETRHLPLPDAETSAYWDAAREHRLLFSRCRGCGHAFHYPRTRCPSCFSSNVSWEESSGRGVVHSYTVVRQNHAHPFRDRLPYVVALVDLDEGPRLMSNVDVANVERVHIDQRVRVRYREESADVTLPVFVPDEVAS